MSKIHFHLPTLWFKCLFFISLPINILFSEVSFNREILPILSDKCFHCHGQDASHRKAKLRLDLFEEATQEKDGFAAIVPGHPEKSLAFELIQTKDQDDIMPPVKTGKSLTQKEIELIKTWISEGAKYEKHWAFIPPIKEPLPTVKNKDWVQHPIDHYVLAKVEKNGLKPSPKADPKTLIRRLYLDLTATLPPWKTVQAFVEDPSPQHYEKIVDGLLASDAYAERMTMVWLDAARYSDSDGFQVDSTRNNWPWKDWVIQAYKNNMPFDQFTLEQLAGDLLPSASANQILATSFNRHHMTNGEGGRDPEESRIDYVMDRVNTLGTTWLGLTLGCAQCHDHKFDPVSQKEYYQLNAFFNSIDEDGRAGGGAKPYMSYKANISEQALKDAETWYQKMSEHESELKKEKLKSFAPWLQNKSKLIQSQPDFKSWQTVQVKRLKTSNGSQLRQLPSGDFIVSGDNPMHEDHIVVTQPDFDFITGLRLNIKPHPDNTQGGFSKSEDGHFLLTNLKVFERSISTGIQKSVALKSAIASYDKKVKGKKYGPAKGVLDDDPRTGWASNGAEFKDLTMLVQFENPTSIDKYTEIVIELRHRSTDGHESCRHFSLELTNEFGHTLTKLKATPSEVLANLNGDISKLSPETLEEFKEEYLSSLPEIKIAREKSAHARAAVSAYSNFSKPQNVMVMKERDKPRDTHLLLRGEWDKKGEVVQPGIPKRLSPWPEGAPRNRLGLAKWIVDRNNPLTARVAVNRYWQMIFGTGLVRTPEDFGLQGNIPVYSELLDWLAVEFMKSNWNVKHTLKNIVMSQTYQQSSTSSPKLQQKDPENLLLSRAPRFRMPSWMIRDTLLDASDILTDRVGGPPVYPYQPAGAWKDSTMGRFTYKVSPGKDAYRKSLYTFWRRSVGPTNMFDSSKRRNCSTRTVRTNTPLHALNLMNDENYLESARHLAKQALANVQQTEQRIQYLATHVLCRELKPRELSILKQQLDKNFSYFDQSPQAADDLLQIGQMEPGQGKHPARDVAAYLMIAQTIMNLDEAITRE